jgi:hypothetical protein
VEPTEHSEPISVGIGNALITFPRSWRIDSKSEEGIIARSASGRERATISIISFNKPISFDQFSLMCHQRVEAERRGLKDGFVHPDPPAPRDASDGFRLLYTGGDKSTHRVFSAYLIQIESQVVTVYLESLGIPLTEHSETFRALLSTLKRRKRTLPGESTR